MFDELVERLRKTQKLAEYAAEDVAKMPNMIFGEAADAVEELSREYESLATSLNEAVEAVHKLQSKLYWVPARAPWLPTGDDEVLCWISKGKPEAGGYCMTGYYNPTTQSWELDAEWASVLDITHWMPRPEPPKEEAPTGPYDLLYEEGGPDA